MATTITSVLGEERSAVVNELGEYACPFCHGYARLGEACGNPACDAGRWATRERALKGKAERERKQAEEAERQRRSAAMADYSERYAREQEEKRRALLAEAEEEGFCPRCILGYGAKRVRHRRSWREFHEEAVA